MAGQSFYIGCHAQVWDVRYTRGDSGKVAPTELEVLE